MKYNNYALSLILLASTTLASLTVPINKKSLNKIAADIKKIVGNKTSLPKVIKAIDSQAKITKAQKEEICKLSKFEINDIKDALNTAAKRDTESYVQFIMDELNGTPNNPDIDLSFYRSADSEEKVAKIKEFPTLAGGWDLERCEIETYVLGGDLPEKLPQVKKILKIADSGKISDKDVSLYGVDLDTTQYQAIEKFEKYSDRLLEKSELESFIAGGSLPEFTPAEKHKAILGLSTDKLGGASGIEDFATAKQIQVIIAKEAELNGRIADDLLEKILKATNDTELDELAKPIVVPPPALPETNTEKVAFILALTAPDVKLTGIDKSLYREVVGDKEIAAIAAKENETGKKITDSELLFILTNPAGSDEAESTGEPEPTRTNTTEDLATKVFAHAKNGKFEEASRPALLELGVTEAQINKLIASAGLDKKEKVDAVLKSATESNPEAATTTTPASAAADVSTQILNLALGNNKQLDATKHEAVLKGLLLNEAQIKALLAAKDLDSKDKVQNIITANATPKERTPAEIAAEVLNKYVKDGKIEATHRAALEALQISAAQIDELFKATGLDVAKIENILKVPVTPAAPAAPTKIDFAAIFELVSGGKIAESSKAALKALGLNDTQVDLILKASGLDSVAKIEQLLQPSKPGKPEEVSSNASNTGNIAANADAKDEGSLLTNPWILGIGAVVLVAAIGGGAYFMTRKTDETEL